MSCIVIEQENDDFEDYAYVNPAYQDTNNKVILKGVRSFDPEEKLPPLNSNKFTTIPLDEINNNSNGIPFQLLWSNVTREVDLNTGWFPWNHKTTRQILQPQNG